VPGVLLSPPPELPVSPVEGGVVPRECPNRPWLGRPCPAALVIPSPAASRPGRLPALVVASCPAATLTGTAAAEVRNPPGVAALSSTLRSTEASAARRPDVERDQSHQGHEDYCGTGQQSSDAPIPTMKLSGVLSLMSWTPREFPPLSPARHSRAPHVRRIVSDPDGFSNPNSGVAFVLFR